MVLRGQPIEGKALRCARAGAAHSGLVGWGRRLGAVAERSVDVKLLAATQVDLRQAVADGRFREDLYHPWPS